MATDQGPLGRYTARAREVYRPAPRSIFLHLHLQSIFVASTSLVRHLEHSQNLSRGECRKSWRSLDSCSSPACSSTHLLIRWQEAPQPARYRCRRESCYRCHRCCHRPHHLQVSFLRQRGRMCGALRTGLWRTQRFRRSHVAPTTLRTFSTVGCLMSSLLLAGTQRKNLATFSTLTTCLTAVVVKRSSQLASSSPHGGAR